MISEARQGGFGPGLGSQPFKSWIFSKLYFFSAVRGHQKIFIKPRIKKNSTVESGQDGDEPGTASTIGEAH